MSKMVGILGMVFCGGTALSVVLAWPRDTDNYDLPEKLDDFKKGDGGLCVQNLFRGAKTMDNTGSENANAATTDLTISAADAVKGCLLVNWDKRKTSDNNDKWQANLRFLWSMAKDQKGFVLFGTGNTVLDSSAIKANYRAMALVLEQKENGWEVTKKKEITEDKKLEKDKIPKPNTNLDKIGANTSFFGMMTDSEATDKVCGTSDCSNVEEQKPHEWFRGCWTWKPDASSQTTADSWSSNIKEWGNTVFGESTIKIEEVVKNVKGSWSGEKIDRHPSS